jgi:hypothetical protein
VHQPADIRCQLLRFRARQHHRVIQGVQKTVFRYPPALFDQLLVHHADLSGRAAEADKTQLKPVKKASRKETGNGRSLTVSEIMDIGKFDRHGLSVSCGP